MTSINHDNNLCFATLHFPSSTPPSSSAVPHSSTSSTGWTLKISEKIKELNKQLQDLRSRQSDQYGYLPEQDSKSLDSIPTQLTSLGTMQKLAEFAESLTNSNDNNIINNLCDGLETFLGFNSASKGYDGKGIVYSDLDRLCDAVMGFLSGVLSNMKDHLGQHKGQITDAITSLETNKHLGKKGFSVAIAQVVAGVRGYNDKVRESNEKVKKPIKKLTKAVQNRKATIEKVYGDKEETISEADKLLDKLVAEAGIYMADLKAAKGNIDDLNRELRSKVNNATELVVHESGRLHDLAWKAKDDLVGMKKAINTALENLKKFVSHKVGTAIEQLVEMLKAAVHNILKHLKQIDEGLLEYVNKLSKWMKDAKEFINVLQTTRIKNIIDEVTEPQAGISNKRQKAREAIENVERQLGTKVEELTQWKDAANFIINKAQGKCDLILERVYQKKGGGIVDIKDYAKKLKDKAARLLRGYQSVQEPIDSLKGNISRALGELENKIAEDLHNLKNGIKSELRKVIEAFKKGIVDAGETDSGGNATSIIENFSYQMEKDTVPNLKAWGDQVKSSGEFFAAMERLGKTFDSKDFTSFKPFLKTFPKLEDMVNGKPTSLFTAINSDLDRKLDEKLPGNGQKVRLSVLGRYNVEKDKNRTGEKSLYQRLLTEDIPNALSAFKDMSEFEEHKEQLNGGAINGAQDAVGKHLTYIENELKAITWFVDTYNKSAAKPVDYDGDDDEGIKQHLEKLSKNALGVDESWTCNDKNAKGLDLIKTQLDTLKKEDVGNALGRVAELCSTITNEGALANGLLETLKTTNIGKLLNDIKEQMESLRNNSIREVMLDAESIIINEANLLREKYVDEIQRYVNQQISSATSTLTTAARRNYVSSVKSLLTAFADKVGQELRDLPEEIERDLTIGFKGLMRVMGGDKYTVKQDNSSPFDDDSRTKLFDAISQLATSLASKLNGAQHLENFKSLSTNFHKYFTNIHGYMKQQISPESPPQSHTKDRNVELLTDVKSKFTDLLDHLKTDTNQPRTYIFDDTYTKKHESLSTSLTALQPSSFANPRHPELLDAVRAGLQGFVGEMERVYVSKYEGGKYVDWSEKDSNDGQNCAKILLSLIPDWFDHLNWLLLECNGGQCKDDQIYIKDNDKTTRGTRLGIWFRQRGYKVSKGAKNQDGELRSNDKFKGGQIKDILVGNSKCVYSTENLNKPNLLNRLLGHLQNYRKVCHLKYTPKAKPPTTVYQMLLWLTGLYWNNMYDRVNAYIPKWYGELTAEYDLGGKPLEVAMPESGDFRTIQKFSASELQGLFNNVTIYTEKVLIAILGHGQENGRYACDFYTNRDDLDYPSNVGVCFDMFIDICMRLNQQLRFLYKQCTNYMEQSGWRDCHYGKGIAGSSWNCNSLQCPNQIGDQSHKQKCDQQCDQTPKCGVKSPLQSFLEDGLHGFLPHQFTSPGCKLTCSMRDHAGKTCLTPMGFADIGIAASHTETGEHLRSILEQFCGTLTKRLTMFCAYVTCLQRRPPQTLGDMFAFYHNFLGNWKGQGGKHKEKAFQQAVNGAIFGREYTGLNPESIQVSKKHDEGKHAEGDLFGLLNCDPDKDANLPCGQYLQPLTLRALSLFTDKHANLYLSWIMYMTETFYDLLAQLWNQCCKNCDTPGTRCHDRRCSKKCTVKYSSNDSKSTAPSEQEKHTTDCNSIVKCQNTHPTIYKYGFTFGSPYRLSGAQHYQQQMRTCKDFCEALERVLAKDSLLVKLIGSIDEFMWTIREPFSYLVLALWSASFLYLLYVYIGRLDTLHIRSHLRIPSSHKITAQSLLAAARIGKLAKISYLQP